MLIKVQSGWFWEWAEEGERERVESVREFTGTDLITGSDRNGPIFSLSPAKVLAISIQNKYAD